jgi:ATP-binding protein involved in chromosome partitioning
VVFTADRETPSLQPQDDKWYVPSVKKIIAVASGKGGVGKSTTAVNLALALSRLGYKTAVFDADIYGPSVPTMLGFANAPGITYDGKHIEPFEAFGLKAMSIGSMIDKDTPLIWRGAKACGAIQQLFNDTNWGDIDVMVIDMPPGTGDIQITLSQKMKIDEAVIVSTPQDIALIDAIKGVNMFKQVGVKIAGIVENMSYYLCEKCGTRADIFGHAGAKAAAAKMGETFLGEIPLHITIRENADRGTPIVYTNPNSEYAQAYLKIAEQL